MKRREKSPNCTSKKKQKKTVFPIENVVKLIEEKSNIVVLVGAGISVSCGIPDFRSETGLYSMLDSFDLDLPYPESLFEIDFFQENPKPFYKFAKQMFPTNFTPSITHRFLRMLEQKKKLCRVYTQNIDALESVSGVTKVVPCHGSFATASCLSCGNQVEIAHIRDEIFQQLIPTCKLKHCSGIMKPDITFFGEKLNPKVSQCLSRDQHKADLLLVLGTSLKVSPVRDIPRYFQTNSDITKSAVEDIPQILINLESFEQRNPSAGPSFSFHHELLGECDVIIEYLLNCLNWKLDNLGTTSNSPCHFHAPNKFCFTKCRIDTCIKLTESSDDKAYPESFTCDDCGCILSKGRYSCTKCFDFDLCFKCFSDGDNALIKTNHKGHKFARH